MSSQGTEFIDPQTMLACLGEGFFADDSWLKGCHPLSAAAIPSELRRLLVHERHMTGILGAHWGQPPSLKVLEVREEGATYRRKIALLAGGGGRVVEFGLVRLNLDVLPGRARSDVTSQAAPLGEIFARYDVLTRVEPRWYVGFHGVSPVVQYFAPMAPVQAFGRLGVIHCNGQPAVELLEVVPG